MNPHGPHDQRGTAHWRADEVVMDTFTVRLPRWPVLLRLLGRDPLVRTTDRIEALVLVLVVALSLLAAPITAAVGTAVTAHDGRDRQSATDDPKKAAGHDDRTGGHRHRPTVSGCRNATNRGGIVVRRGQARASNPHHHGS